MTSGAINLTTAPRDLDKLQVIGPFMLKHLMGLATEKITGKPITEERKQAFLMDPVDKRAKDVLDMLLLLDKNSGAEPAAPAPEEKAAKPPRTPRAAPAAAAATATPTNGAVNGSASHAVDGVLLSSIDSLLKGVSDSLKTMQDTLETVEKGSKQRVETLEMTLTQMFKLQHLTMGLLLQVAENQLGATSAQLLEGVADEYEKAETIINSMISGK